MKSYHYFLNIFLKVIILNLNKVSTLINNQNNFKLAFLIKTCVSSKTLQSTI